MRELAAFVTPLFAMVAAMWVFWQFLIRRASEPGAELDVDLTFVGQQDEKWLIEVVAILKNQSQVRHWYHDFRLVVRYLLPQDAIVDADPNTNPKVSRKLNYQLYCTRTIDERIGGAQRHFADVDYIDPNLTFRHSYVTFVPADATFVWVQCSLQFPGKRHWYELRRVIAKKSVQRIFGTPRHVHALAST
jgi:hypothetical protein